MSSPVPPSTGTRFACFDGLRAIAALLVLGVHTAFISGFTGSSSLGIYTSRLEIGVSVFFVISGFLLYRPFALAHLQARTAPRARPFWVRRLRRIVPGYWVAYLVVTYLFGADVTARGWWSPVVDMGFAQIYPPSEVTRGISQAWSLCTEMSFYLLLPVWAWLLGRRSGSLHRSPVRQLHVELAGVGGWVALSFGFRLWCLNQPGFAASVMPNWLPAYADLFALGMLLAVLTAWFEVGGRQPSFVADRWFPWCSWAMAGVAFVAVAHLGIPVSPIYRLSVGTDLLRQTLYGLFAFFLVIPAALGPQTQGAIRAVLRSRPLVAVGVVSYGVYLWHEAAIALLVRWTGAAPFSIPWQELFPAVLVMTLVVATFSYRLVERPLQAKRRGVPRLGPQTHPGPAVVVGGLGSG